MVTIFKATEVNNDRNPGRYPKLPLPEDKSDRTTTNELLIELFLLLKQGLEYSRLTVNSEVAEDDLELSTHQTPLPGDWDYKGMWSWDLKQELLNARKGPCQLSYSPVQSYWLQMSFPLPFCSPSFSPCLFSSSFLFFQKYFYAQDSSTRSVWQKD